MARDHSYTFRDGESIKEPRPRTFSSYSGSSTTEILLSGQFKSPHPKQCSWNSGFNEGNELLITNISIQRTKNQTLRLPKFPEFVLAMAEVLSFFENIFRFRKFRAGDQLGTKAEIFCCACFCSY